MALTRPSEVKRRKGTMNLAQTKKWDGTKWIPVNVAHDGQRATRNGKPVIRKGGKFVPYSPVKRGYNPVSRDTSKNKPSSSTSNTTAVDKAKAKREAEAAAERTAAIKKRAEAKALAEKKRLADQRAGRGNTAPPAPRLPSRSAPPKAPSKKSAASTFRDKRDTKGLKIGRAFTLKEHQELVKERKRKKSAAEKAGYPGQRNY